MQEQSPTPSATTVLKKRCQEFLERAHTLASTFLGAVIPNASLEGKLLPASAKSTTDETHTDDDENTAYPTPTECLPRKGRNNVTPSKSLVRFQNQELRVYDSTTDLPIAFQEGFSSTSKTEPLFYTKSRENTEQKLKAISKVGSGKVFASPSKFVVSDCWKATSGEIRAELIELFKEGATEEEGEESRIKKRKLSLEDTNGEGALEKLSYTKEFHVLTEVQKARILTVIEDTIKKLANSDFKDYYQVPQGGSRPENPSFVSQGVNLEKYFYKKFLMPWIIMKIVELVVCHIIQLTFLSNELYFQRKSQFLPVVVTYYFTLSIIIFSLAMHISCYGYEGFQNPCYFMCVISSSILTLTTALGILIMLCLMQFYKSFREILVLVFIGALLCSLIAELCICYIEVKNFWSRVHNTDQYYIS